MCWPVPAVRQLGRTQIPNSIYTEERDLLATQNSQFSPQTHLSNNHAKHADQSPLPNPTMKPPLQMTFTSSQTTLMTPSTPNHRPHINTRRHLHFQIQLQPCLLSQILGFNPLQHHLATNSADNPRKHDQNFRRQLDQFWPI